MTEPVAPVALMTGMPAPAAPIPAPSAPPEPVDMDGVVTNMLAFREQAIEGLGSPGMRFRPGGPGTEIFTVRHPLLLSDAQNEEISKPMNFIGVAKVLLNTAEDPGVYGRFVAAGGQAGDVMLAWQRLKEGLDVPKSATQ